MIIWFSEMDLSWSDLTHEALVEIFKRVGFEDLYQSVPLVCTTWRNASLDSACWERVNMEDSFRKREETMMWWQPSFEKKIDYMVKLVVDRSRGRLLELSTRHCSNAALSYLASRCPLIRSISVASSSGVTDLAACQIAKACVQLEQLDVSECQNLTFFSMEEFGVNCKFVTVLKRNRFIGECDPARKNLLPSEYLRTTSTASADGEVYIFSKLMPNLKHLELRYSKLTDQGLALIVDGCPNLEYLDLVGCSNLTKRALDQARGKLKNLKEFKRAPVANHLGNTRYGHWRLYDERFQSGFFQF